MSLTSSSSDTGQLTAPRLSWLALLGAFDPGWTNMRNAGRAVVSVVISGLLVAGLALWLKPPLMSVIVAVLIAVMNEVIALLVVAERPITKRARLLVGMLLTIAGVGTLTLLAAQISLLLARLLFVIAVYVGLTVRARGLDFALWGTLAMLDSLLLLMVGATTAQIPWIAIAALISTGVVYLARFVILPPKPLRLLNASLESHRTRIVLTLNQFASALTKPEARSRARVRRYVDRVSVSMSILESRLTDPMIATIIPEKQRDQIQCALIDVNLAIEALFLVVQQHLAPSADRASENQQPMIHTIRAVAAWVANHEDGTTTVDQRLAQLRERAQQLAQAEPPQFRRAFELLQVVFASEHVASYVDTMQQVRGQLNAAGIGQPARDAAAPTPPTSAAGMRAPGEGSLPQQSPFFASLGFKAALASLIALIAGPIISPAHPYWIALTAYVIVAASYGATLRNALTRSSATVVGVVVGVAVGAALTHVPGATVITAIVGCAIFFLGVFLSAVSPALLSGCFMIIFGMAYTYIMGLQQATPLLAERVGDALVGALIGVGITTLIPTPRGRQTLITHAQSFLGALGTTVRDSLARLTSSDDSADSSARGRALDAAYQAIITSATDARYEWGVLHDPHDLEENLLIVRALNILAKQVVRAAQRQPALQDPHLREPFARLGQHLDEYARAIGTAIADSENNITVSANAFPDLRDNVMQLIDIQQSHAPTQPTQAAIPHLIFNLLLIDRLLTNLARRMKIKLIAR